MLAGVNHEVLQQLKAALKKIDDQIRKTIMQNNDFKHSYNLLNSIPGIGIQTITYLLIVTRNFTLFNHPKKLACYCGVAPFPYQSGTSIKGKNKVHHFANKKLKSLLQMCAMNAKRYDFEIGHYFHKKIEEGKNKMLVYNNIRNKLLKRVFAVIKRQQPYVNVHKFAA